MKTKWISIILIFTVLVVLLACSDSSTNDGTLSPDLIENPNTANGSGDMTSPPKFKFKTTEHDFGKIVDGVKVSFTFKFKNTGGSDLIISQVKTSCGCTVSKYSEGPIPPGKEGRVQLTFDSSHRRGFNNKIATVIANTQPNTEILKIKAMVLGPEEL